MLKNRLFCRCVLRTYIEWMHRKNAKENVPTRKEYVQQRFNITDEDFSKFDKMLNMCNFGNENETVSYIVEHW